jgi:hypothetical protein
VTASCAQRQQVTEALDDDHGLGEIRLGCQAGRVTRQADRVGFRHAGRADRFRLYRAGAAQPQDDAGVDAVDDRGGMCRDQALGGVLTQRAHERPLGPWVESGLGFVN